MLECVTLLNVNVAGARFGGTLLGDLDLSKVKGLATAVHVGPSILGLDTVLRSGDRVLSMRGARAHLIYTNGCQVALAGRAMATVAKGPGRCGSGTLARDSDRTSDEGGGDSSILAPGILVGAGIVAFAVYESYRAHQDNTTSP